MIKLTATIAALLLSLAPVGLKQAAACGAAAKPTATVTKERPAKVATASFKVDGMHCSGCSDKVTAALNAQPGVISVKVALADHRVTVEYDPSKLDTGKIAKIMSDAGYPATAEA
jgi:copper chaperone CopZ